MLLAPSPTNARLRPASAGPVAVRPPQCSAIVWRSASTWHGWNWSVRALTTGTPATSAISSIRAWS